MLRSSLPLPTEEDHSQKEFEKYKRWFCPTYTNLNQRRSHFVLEAHAACLANNHNTDHELEIQLSSIKAWGLFASCGTSSVQSVLRDRNQPTIILNPEIHQSDHITAVWEFVAWTPSVCACGWFGPRVPTTIIPGYTQLARTKAQRNPLLYNTTPLSVPRRNLIKYLRPFP